MGMVVEEGEEGGEDEDDVLVCVGGVVGAASMPVDSNSSVLLEGRNMEKMDM